MIIAFLMSSGLSLCSANDSPRRPHCLWTVPTQGWHICGLSRVSAALEGPCVSQVVNKPYWGNWDEDGRTESPPRNPLPQPPTRFLFLFLFFLLFMLTTNKTSVVPSTLFRPHPSLHHLPRSVCFCAAVSLQHMPALLGHQLHSEDFMQKSSSGRHYEVHRWALWLMLHPRSIRGLSLVMHITTLLWD